MKTVVIVNGKGGVGKSTTCAHLAYRSAEMKRKTLAIDLDTQGNLTQSLISKETIKKHKGITDLIYGNETVSPIIITEYLHLIPATSDLTKIESDKDVDVYFKLKEKLFGYNDNYELCTMDTPGDLLTRVACALVSANNCVIPIELQDFAVEAVKDTITFIEKIRTRFNPKLIFTGIIGNKYDPTRTKEQEIKEFLEKTFKSQMLGIIGNRAAINDALTSRLPVWNYKYKGKKDQKARTEMLAVTDKILNKIFEPVSV